MNLDTNCKILCVVFHSDIKNIPKRKQYNHSISLLVKAKTVNRCCEIISQVVGYTYEFNEYARSMGYNKSDNSKFLKLTNDYDECVFYELMSNDDYILFDGFDNKLRDKSKEILFDLNVPDFLKDIIDNGVNFNRLLGDGK